MKKLFLFAALFVAAAFSSCSKHDNVETPDPIVVPDPQPLAIAFAEGNSLQFDVDETKIVHYTITGGNANNVVKVEMQTSDGAYTVETTPTSATEGTIAITAKNPTDNCVLVTVSNSSQSVTMVIVVSPKPALQELAITFAEGNSLEFDPGETKIVHYTITGGNANNVVKVEMQNPDGAYILSMTSTSATEGTIKITAQTPTENRVIVTVSDGSQTIMAPIDVTVILRASFDGKTIVVETPGTLWNLLADYDKTTITELTVIGNLGSSDIKTLNNLPNLAVLDMEHVNLEELPDYAFWHNPYNTSLTSVKLPLALKTIGNYAFQDCRSLTSVTIPNSVTEIEWAAFLGCSSLTSITLPDSITSIGYNVFCKCSSLTSITIPNSVTTIGQRAFYGCSGLTSITIPDSVTSIGEWAFFHCSSLTSVTIPDSVMTIEFSTFSSCSGLTSVTIGNGVTTIAREAFCSCTSLKNVMMGNSVTGIARAAFLGCHGLTSVYCQAIVPPSVKGEGQTEVFSSRRTLYVPTGSKEAYAAADEWRSFSTIEEVEF